MITELQNINVKELEADLCIIGGGPAGLTIANNFINTNFSVILIESGSLNYDKTTQSLSSGLNEHFGEYPFPSYSLIGARIRALGGSSLVWRGSSGPLQDIDFQEKSWVPNSGWPISLSDIKKYYLEAQGICDLGPYLYENNFFQRNHFNGKIFDSDIFKFNYWQFPEKTPTRFGKKFYKVLQNAENIKLILNANFNDFFCNEENSHIKKIKVSSIKKKNIEIKSKIFVLATGGIENARLILNHKKKYNVSLGEPNNNVGAYFMEHPHCVCAEFFPNKNFMNKYFSLIKRHIFATNNMNEGAAKIGWGLTLNDKEQEKNKILNSCLTFNINRFLELPSLISLLYMLQAKNIPLKKKIFLSMLINDSPSIIKESIQTFLINNKYKLPKLYIYSRSEQSPNYSSQVSLSNEKDFLGTHKVILNWKMSQLDKSSIFKTVSVLGSLLNKKYGILRPRDWLYGNSNFGWDSKNDKKFILGIGHHMGTTRMSKNKNDGVVDKNCKMYGLTNLYVAGSSVFPTGGYINPTLTIVALSLRLADHLKKIIK